MKTSTIKPQSGVLRLALLDLRHEWILTLCMVLAIAAVLAPLLILMGLKYGTVETLRTRLVEDPVNREIRPANTLQLPQKWFDRFEQRDDIDFIIPTILRGSSVVRISKPDTRKSFIFDLVPTAPNDPLILENQGVIPQENEFVLSYTAAEELGGVKAGDMLNIEITRTRNKRRESIRLELKVAAILNPRADALPRVYAPFELVNDVEAYREGRAVPKRNWAGGKALPPLSFDGVWVLVPNALSSLDESRLTINTGLANVKLIEKEEVKQLLHFELPDNYFVYQISGISNTILSSNIKSVKNKLRGKSAIIIPYANGIEIRQASGEILKVLGLSLSEAKLTSLDLPVLPWDKFDKDAEFGKIGQILLPNIINSTEKIELETTTLDGEKLNFALNVVGNSSSDYAIVPIELMGILRTGLDNKIVFDKSQQNFILSKAGFRGFRLYAKGIDDVPTLYKEFISQDINVITKVQDIEKVKILDRGLTRIFWLIAIVGIIGGMAALVASLYASVERKKRDISVLRLMGLSRFEVFKFPIYQALFMAIMSVLFAIGVYSLLASIINYVFSADLQMGQKICTLPTSYFVYTLLLTGSIAALSSLLAAWKTTEIDPAEALREE
ncbi:MAG: ABC transporter permease [Thiotrichaceae bacterium]|nr:ABC transporter permease [Thiotrichaceae bacterium]